MKLIAEQWVRKGAEEEKNKQEGKEEMTGGKGNESETAEKGEEAKRRCRMTNAEKLIRERSMSGDTRDVEEERKGNKGVD